MPWMADIEVRLADGDLDTLLAAADELLNGVRRFHVRPFLSDALYARGRVLLALGRAEEAWNALDEARAEASAIGCRRTLWRILETMSTEAARRGDNESALKPGGASPASHRHHRSSRGFGGLARFLPGVASGEKGACSCRGSRCGILSAWRVLKLGLR